MTFDPVLATALAIAHAPFAIFLSYIDARDHRLPNVAVLGVSGTVTTVAGIYGLVRPSAASAVQGAVLIAIAGTVLAVLLALFIPGSIGMGDAKVLYSTLLPAALLGGSVIVGACAWICLVGAVVAVAVLIATRGDTKARFAFGPILVSAPYGGVALAILASG